MAARVALGYPVEAVVERIRELNDLASSGVVPGHRCSCPDTDEPDSDEP